MELKTEAKSGWSVSLNECKDLRAVAFGDKALGVSGLGESDGFVSNLTFFFDLWFVVDAVSIVILISLELSQTNKRTGQ